MSDEKRPLSPEEQWRAIALTSMGAEARELEEMTDEEVDRELRASGIDPDRLAREGNALAERLLRELTAAPANAPARAREPERTESAQRTESVEDHGAKRSAPDPDPDHDRDRDRDRDPDPAHDRDPDPDPVQAQPAVLPFPSRPRPRWPLLLLAAALALAAITTGAAIALRDRHPPTRLLPGPTSTRREPPPEEVARRLRDDAEEACGRSEWQACLDGLDRARGLDPAGDTTVKAQILRATAVRELAAPDGADAGAGDKKGEKGDKRGGGAR